MRPGYHAASAVFFLLFGFLVSVINLLLKKEAGTKEQILTQKSVCAKNGQVIHVFFNVDVC
jgi:hypothetical protein